MSQREIPAIKEPSFFPHPDYQHITLHNGIPVHVLPIAGVSYTNIGFNFRAGQRYQHKTKQARFTIGMLREGTTTRTREAIFEELDFLGVTLKDVCTYNYSELFISSASKRLKDALPIVEDILCHPSFPQEKLKIQQEANKVKLLHLKDEVGHMAITQLKQMMYGDNHVLAYEATAEDIDAITCEDLKAFHKEYYGLANMELFVIGKLDEEELALLNKHFGDKELNGKKAEINSEMPINPWERKCALVPKENCLQSAVYIGRLSIDINHPDFYKLNLLIRVLGGYFGSRLMSNIREEKGYTYGINSLHVTAMSRSVIYIISETAVQYTQPLIDEVKKEMKRLQDELIPAEELEMVRSYFIGVHLQTMSKGMDLYDDFRTNCILGIDSKAYYEKWWEVLHETTAEELQEMAKKYLNPEDFYYAVAGEWKEMEKGI